ncbi:MAG: putative metal-binding motif-containing protein [Myxococcota bacterium]
MTLRSCPGCNELVDAKACACPHCAVTLRVCSTRASRAAGAALLGLALAGCDGPPLEVQPEYGVPVVDLDGDGYPEEVDCDDSDGDIHPDATETVGDGVDSNCDGEDDT